MAGVASTRLAAVAADETAAPQAAAPGFRSLSSNLRRITPGQRRDGAIRRTTRTGMQTMAKQAPGAAVSPSQFMRQIRPELYSDSTSRTNHRLNAEVLSHHLETVTVCNQTHEFELFKDRNSKATFRAVYAADSCRQGSGKRAAQALEGDVLRS